MGLLDRILGRKRKTGPMHVLAEVNELGQHLIELFNAGSLDDGRAVIEQFPDLLTEEADDLLVRLLAVETRARARDLVQTWREILRRCREEGLEAVFGELKAREAENSRGSAVPPPFKEVVYRIDEAEERYVHSGDRDAIDEVIQLWEWMLTHPDFAASENRFRLVVLNNTGSAYLRRYWERGRLGDLNRALDLCKRAATLMPEDAPDLPARLNNLGNLLNDRYARSGRFEDLEEAIRAYEQAVAMTPPDSPDLPSRLNNLGTGLSDRYARTGRAEDLDEAVNAHYRAVELTPEDSPDLPARLNTLGNGLRAWYARTGRAEDLDEAVNAHYRAVELTPEDSPNLPAFLTNLGIGLWTRYARTGRAEDLEKAIQAYHRAVEFTPENDPDLPAFLTNLGIGLRTQYRRTGRVEDLEEAIQAYRRAVELTPEDSPDMASRLNNLGTGLNNRYARTGQVEDLEEAIQAYRRAVELTPEDSPDMPGYLNNLGAGLSDWFIRTGRVEDLEEAIQSYHRAVELTSENSPDLPEYLNNLGTGLSDQYAHGGQAEDLEKAIQAYRRAVELTPEDSPDLASRLNNLGTGLSDQYAHTNRVKDLEEAIAAYRRACELGLARTPEEALRSAHNWGGWALERAAWEEAAEAYGYGVQAIESLLDEQIDRAGKESWLREAQQVSPRLAYALTRLNRLAEAVEAVENGRARLLAEALEATREDLRRLAQANHPTYMAYQEARQRIDHLSTELKTAPVKGDGARRSNATVRRELDQAREALQAAIAAIRSIPGHEDFFAEPTFDKIAQAAANAPLVYLAATPAGGLALIVQGQTSKVSAVWLDDFTEKAVRDQVSGPGHRWGGYLGAYLRWRRSHFLGTPPRERWKAKRSWFRALDRYTNWLWDAAMGPVVEALHELGREKAVLIPGGWLGLLPLHAAWTPDASRHTGKRYALDEILFTYAPSARALLRAQERAGRVPADAILAIDNPLGDLPNSQLEVTAAVDHFPENRLVLRNEAATPAAVKAALPAYPVYHFSCHGRADFNEARNSGLLLAGEEKEGRIEPAPLTLGDFYDLRLDPGARLAVLSACETGIPSDLHLPNEVVSLPTGLVQAGVAGVVASLWSVADLSTMMLMAMFYEYWRGEGLAIPEALRKAQQWVRDTTNAEKQAYFEAELAKAGMLRMAADPAAKAWMHALARAPEERSFKHPFYWAAFGFTGAA